MVTFKRTGKNNRLAFRREPAFANFSGPGVQVITRLPEKKLYTDDEFPQSGTGKSRGFWRGSIRFGETMRLLPA